MRKSDVQIGRCYVAKVSDKMTAVRITGENPHGGWDAVNVDTKRPVRIKSAQRLRRPITTKPEKKVLASEPAKKAVMSLVNNIARRELGALSTTPPAAPVSRAPKARKKAKRKDGTMSGLDAAARVLAEAGEPLNCKAIVERAIEKGYWKTGGKTPAATIYAAILRDTQKKGEASRFRKADRGKFAMAR